MEDMDLRWQVDQLSRNLQNAFPNLPWQQSQNFLRRRAHGLREMPGLLDTLGDLDRAREPHALATQPGELAEVDIERARELLGDDARGAPSTVCATSPRCWRRPADRNSAKAGSSSRRAPIRAIATRRCPTSTASW